MLKGKGLYGSLMRLPYFAVYNAHFFAQIFEGKTRMCSILGYNGYAPWV